MPNANDSILQGVIDGVAASGGYEIEAKSLQNGLFKWHPTIKSQAELAVWAAENGLRIENVTVTEGRKRQNLLRFERVPKPRVKR